jgi:suppressor of G2 allele of SKP1
MVSGAQATFSFFSIFLSSHIKLKKFLEALQDAKEASALAPTNHTALLRQGEALFELGEFESALRAFEEGQRHDAEHGAKWDVWLRRCRAELAEEQAASGAQSTQTSVTATGSDAHAPASGTQAPAAVAAAPAPASASAPAPTAPVTPKIRHEWYQTESHVVVTVFCKGLKREQVHETLSETAYSLRLDLPTGDSWEQKLELAGGIVPGESSLQVLSTKLELWLKKRHAARWSTLERVPGADNAPAPAPGVLLPPVATAKPAAYSSKKKVNWDELVKNEKDDSEDPLNAVFKGIYGNGTDEQRRAMMKSYQESGGTVLSTNWEDVGKKKVEVSPPTGMIAKKWGTDEIVAEGDTKK